MKIPFVVEKLSPHESANRIRFSVDETGYDRSVRENIWRRHQAPSNSHLSGWTENGPSKRRLVHFRDRYAVQGGEFVLTDPYLYVHITSDPEGVAAYNALIEDSLREWELVGDRFYQGDLECRLVKTTTSIDTYIHKRDVEIEKEILVRPWVVFGKGIRLAEPRGNPSYKLPEEILDLLPAQIELGCGPSIEAGVPPLNYLHKTYSITKDGMRFVLDAQDDTIFNTLKNPEKQYRAFAHIHLGSLKCKTTPFYESLKTLHQQGAFVGPIITNNFDGIPLSMGLPEFCLRRFDKDGEYPSPEFHPDAKSLIVVGSHADRRCCQQHARKHGLKVVFIDPEGYHLPDKFVPYPLEAPQDEDIIVKMTASKALEKLVRCV